MISACAFVGILIQFVMLNRGKEEDRGSDRWMPIYSTNSSTIVYLLTYPFAVGYSLGIAVMEFR